MAQNQDEPESTKVVVMKMARSRRRGMAVGGLAVALVATGIGIWAGTSAKSCMASRAKGEAAAEASAASDQPPGVMDPEAAKATVYVFLSVEGDLAIDGFPAAKAVTRFKTEVPAGDHTFRAELKKNTFEQALVAKAGEGFLVDFDDDRRAVSIKRLYNVK